MKTKTAIGVRIWNHDDVPMLAEWWTARGLPGPATDLLPPLGVITGPLIGDTVIPHASAFVHTTADRTGIAFLDWLAVAPRIHPAQAMAAVDAAIMFLQQQAKANGYGLLIAIMRDERLARLAEKRHGFTTTNKGVLAQWKDI